MSRISRQPSQPAAPGRSGDATHHLPGAVRGDGLLAEVRIPVRLRGQIVAYATVDPDDAGLAEHNWGLDRGYARRTIGGIFTSMHRVVLGLSARDERIGDHINGDKLDNRRCNLRVISKRLNAQNVRPHRDGRSGIRGAHWNKQQQKWHAKVRVSGTTYYFGSFDTAQDAGAVAATKRQELGFLSSEARP